LQYRFGTFCLERDYGRPINISGVCLMITGFLFIMNYAKIGEKEEQYLKKGIKS
jgi:hypothetical protein